MLDVAIIGCGVIGAAAAYELSHYPLQTAIFEAENDVADCTTKANSAILHAGYDPEPGTRMARLNVEGSALAKEICARLDVPYLQCGSLVLALSPEELPHLQKLYENGIANGVPGIRLLSAEETFAMEPNLAPTVVGALYAPSAAIVSPWEFALAMAEVAVHNGVELHRSCPVTRIEKTAGGWALTTPSGIVETRYIINAAGISAQAVHDMAAPHKFTIQPTRGEYYLLDKSEGSRVHHVIFQCPNENGKGVLVAPTVHGNLIVGPNADPVEGDDTACTAAGLAFVSAAARRSVPNIRFNESIRNFAGVRANVDTGDFVIGEAEGAPGFIDLAGMKSPGLSSAPAVAREAVKILEAHGDLPAPKAPVQQVRDGGIEFEHVTFKYKHGSGQPVLNDVTFSIRPGETLGIIGGTGSAKSSLVQLIPRLYDAETGSVKVGGVDVKDYSLDVLRREVSMVLQKNVLFSGTILDNLRWGDENASEEECIRVAKLACADEFIERFPDKYNTWIEQGGSNVSGGQKQRLTIARALLRKPKVLILDDSTSAVDTATDAKIRKAFREEIPGTTKIIIAQRISSVQDADRILVLDNGQINGLGTHEELLKTNKIYQEVYNSQTQGGGDFDKQGGEQ